MPESVLTIKACPNYLLVPVHREKTMAQIIVRNGDDAGDLASPVPLVLPPGGKNKPPEAMPELI